METSTEVLDLAQRLGTFAASIGVGISFLVLLYRYQRGLIRDTVGDNRDLRAEIDALREEMDALREDHRACREEAHLYRLEVVTLKRQLAEAIEGRPWAPGEVRPSPDEGPYRGSVVESKEPPE